jgi:hypothetical protein
MKLFLLQPLLLPLLLLLLLQTYGPPGRSVGLACLPCSTSKTGFSFEWQLQNDIFSARPISRAGADKPCDCLAEYQQMLDGAW